MNILFINSFDCSPANSGGVNRVVYILSRQFMKKPFYQCYLGFYEYQPRDKSLAEFSGRIKLSRNFNQNEFEKFLIDNNINIVQINFLKKENLCTIPLIYQIAHKHNIKVLYCLHVCPGFETVTYGTWERLKYSVAHNEHPLTELRRWLITSTRKLVKPFAYRLIRKKYLVPYQNCDRVVLLSAHYKRAYLDIVGLKDSGKFEAIGNALTFAEFASDADIQNKKKQVLVVARFDEFSKRISLALKVWREIEKDERLTDWTLTLVGTGEAMNFYQHLVKKWNLTRVTFTGLQNPIEYYRSSSIFLMTSSAEGWAMTLTEASQMGVATIALDSFAALHDIIDDEYNGKIVSNNDLIAFREALASLMLNDGQRLQMCQNAVRKSREFEIDNIIAKWEDLYRELGEE